MKVPVLAGGWPLLGHLQQLRKHPIELFRRVRDECGEVGELNFAGNRVVLLTGVEAQEAFFRGSDEQLDQAAAYPFMTPVFGRGVVFDATPEQRKQALRNQSLRESAMRGHAEVIAHETERMMAELGERGEIDLLDFFSELTIYTSSACLIGKHFREELTPAYYRVFYELEKGTDALAYVKFISMMFAGHHTTSGTAAWTLIELSQPSASYHNDHSKMVVQLAQPCRVRYRRRDCLPVAP